MPSPRAPLEPRSDTDLPTKADLVRSTYEAETRLIVLTDVRVGQFHHISVVPEDELGGTCGRSRRGGQIVVPDLGSPPPQRAAAPEPHGPVGSRDAVVPVRTLEVGEDATDVGTLRQVGAHANYTVIRALGDFRVVGLEVEECQRHRPNRPRDASASDDVVRESYPPAKEYLCLPLVAEGEQASALEKKLTLFGEEEAEAGEVDLDIVSFDLCEVRVVCQIERDIRGDGVF